MQSFQTTYDAHSNSGEAAGIHFAPYLATNLTRAYIIHKDADDLKRSERIFSSLPGFCLIGWQLNRNVAVKDIIQLRPELILVFSACISSLDLALVRAIKEEVQTTNFVFISREPKLDELKKLFLAGANGYCQATDETKILSLACQTVSLGGIWIDPTVAGNIFGIKKSSEDEPEEEFSPRLLSDREKEVLHLIAEGLTNQEIAIRLWLSRETVKSHVKKIMRKLAVKDRTQAAVAALRLGISV